MLHFKNEVNKVQAGKEGRMRVRCEVGLEGVVEGDVAFNRTVGPTVKN